MGTDWIEESAKRDGPSSAWLVSSERASLVFDEQKTLSRAVEQILASLESAEFNSLKIMRVASEASKRFLGVRYVTVSAQSGHIQESAPFFRAKDLPVRDRARSAPLETKHKARKGQRFAPGRNDCTD